MFLCGFYSQFLCMILIALTYLYLDKNKFNIGIKIIKMSSGPEVAVTIANYRDINFTSKDSASLSNFKY